MKQLTNHRRLLDKALICTTLVVSMLLSAYEPMHAQWDSFHETWRWARFTTESGLPSNHVFDVIETPRGTIWALTHAGLAWYDGYRWMTVDSSKGIPAKPARCAAAYSDDSILVVSELRLFVGGKGGFQSVVIDPESETRVLAVVPEGPHRAFVLVVGALYMFEGNRCTQVPIPSRALTDDQLNLWKTNAGTIWLNTVNGLFRWDGRGWSLKLASKGTMLGVKRVVEDESGHAIAAVMRPDQLQGLWEWHAASGPRRNLTERSGLFLSLDIHPAGHALVAYATGDVRIRRGSSWHLLDPLPAEMRNAELLKFRANGDLWVGSEKGLFLFKASSHRWAYRRHPFGDLRNGVHEICQTRDGSLWLGTLRGVEILRRDGTTRRIEAIQGTMLNTVTGIVEDTEGNVWISSGASFEGAFRWDGKRWKHFGPHEGLDAPRVHKIRLDRSGRLWFLGMGVDYSDPVHQPGALVYSNGRFTRWGKPEGMIHGRMYGFAETSDGARWFATYGGISRWKDGAWKHWTRTPGLRGQTERINTLAADSTDTIWFANQISGLGYIDRNDEVHFLTTSDGLPSNNIWDLRVDERGTIWISTQGGLCSYRDGIWTRFDTKTGLITLRLWEVLPVRDKVYVGSPGSGLTILNLAEPTHAPVVDIVPPAIDKEQALIRWSAYAYFGEQEPASIETRYRLDQNPWSEWNVGREILFTDLPAGNHTVEVQAKGLFGTLQERNTSVTFEIEPRFYQRTIFLAPFAILTAALLFLSAALYDRKRRHADELRRGEERFRLLASTTQDTIYDWDFTTNRIWFNDAAQKKMGYEQGDSMQGLDWWLEHIHPDDRERIRNSIDAIINRKGDLWQEGYRIRRGDGTYVHVLDRAQLIYDHSGRPIRWIGSAVDMTEQKRAEEHLRDLSQRILEAQENERRRVSRELHDSVNQILASAKFRIESLDERIPRRSMKLKQEVKKTKLLLDRVMMEVRRISRNLRPSELDDLGFAPAIRSLADEFAERTGIHIDLTLPESSLSLSPGVELTLYRILQEALTNVEKHSLATSVRIALETTDSLITARIEDNGKGLDPNRAYTTRGKDKGMGLVDIRERLAFVHGTVEISIAKPRGTVMKIQIPLRDVPRAEET